MLCYSVCSSLLLLSNINSIKYGTLTHDYGKLLSYCLRDFRDPDFSFISFEPSLAGSLKAESILAIHIVMVGEEDTNSRTENQNSNSEALNLSPNGI